MFPHENPFYAFLRLIRDLPFLLIYFILATVRDFVSTITSSCHEVDAVGTQEETLEGLREGFIKKVGYIQNKNWGRGLP